MTGFHKIIPRQPLKKSNPDGLFESDRSYVLNNLAFCVEMLDREFISDMHGTSVGNMLARLIDYHRALKTGDPDLQPPEGKDVEIVTDAIELLKRINRSNVQLRHLLKLQVDGYCPWCHSRIEPVGKT